MLSHASSILDTVANATPSGRGRFRAQRRIGKRHHPKLLNRRGLRDVYPLFPKSHDAVAKRSLAFCGTQEIQARRRLSVWAGRRERVFFVVGIGRSRERIYEMYLNVSRHSERNHFPFSPDPGHSPFPFFKIVAQRASAADDEWSSSNAVTRSRPPGNH